MADHFPKDYVPSWEDIDESTDDAAAPEPEYEPAHALTPEPAPLPEQVSDPESVPVEAPAIETLPVLVEPSRPTMMQVVDDVEDLQQTSAQDEAEAKAKRRKRRRRGIGLIISNLLIIAGIAMMATAGGIYVHNQRNYQKIDEENERVAEYAKLSDTDDTPPEVNWTELKAMNPDIVGWLQIPGTVINYPVLQAQDNDYYLNHAPDKSSSIGGSVFLDFEATAPGMVDAHTIIYGHHMRNGSQFKQVADMDDQMLFDNVKTVWYVTEKGNYNLTPLFLYYTSADDVDVRQFKFKNAEDWHDYLKTYLNKAVTRRADAEEAIKEVQHILALSTCNYYDGYGRTILVCAPKSEIPGTEEYKQLHSAVPEQPDMPQEQAVDDQGGQAGEQSGEDVLVEGESNEGGE